MSNHEFSGVGVTYLVSHPIQYQAPLLRRLASRRDIDLRVFFVNDFGARRRFDEGFGREIEWDVDVLSGYPWELLSGWMRPAKASRLRPITYQLRHAVLRAGSQALWVHGHAHHANIRAMSIARRVGLPILYRSETNSQLARNTGLRGRMMGVVGSSLAKQVSAFLAIGTENYRYYQELGVPKEKLFWVPYVVDNEFFRHRAAASAPHRENLRASLGLERQRPIVLFVSKLQGRKRPSDLLSAYMRLSSDGTSEPWPYLLFVGDGEEAPVLRSRARSLGWDSVRFLGFRNQTELPALYDLCDVFVLPSVGEPWGLVVNEVMNAGRPIIVGDKVGCAPDLVGDGDNGYVVRSGDVEGLADRLSALTSDPELAAAMGQASLRRISQWSLDLAINGLVRALEVVAPRPQGTG